MAKATYEIVADEVKSGSEQGSKTVLLIRVLPGIVQWGHIA